MIQDRTTATNISQRQQPFWVADDLNLLKTLTFPDFYLQTGITVIDPRDSFSAGLIISHGAED